MAHNAISQPNEAGGLLTEPLLTTTESAAALSVSKRTFQELVAQRKIGFIKWGRNIRFSRADLEKFIESNRILPVGWKGGKP
jgi:excisionase family DNA binding protein